MGSLVQAKNGEVLPLFVVSDIEIVIRPHKTVNLVTLPIKHLVGHERIRTVWHKAKTTAKL